MASKTGRYKGETKAAWQRHHDTWVKVCVGGTDDHLGMLEELEDRAGLSRRATREIARRIYAGEQMGRIDAMTWRRWSN